MCRSKLGADSKTTTTAQVAAVCGIVLNISLDCATCASNNVYNGRKMGLGET